METVIIQNIGLGPEECEALNTALESFKQPQILPVETDGSRQAVVVCERGTTMEQAQAHYDAEQAEMSE